MDACPGTVEHLRWSGKKKAHGANIQGISGPGGIPLWISEALPGNVHDLAAARELVLPVLRPYLQHMPCLADSGYDGAGHGMHTPVKKPRHGDLDPDTKCRNALLASARCRGERMFALLACRWTTLQHVTASPSRIGDIAKAALVLVQFEHKMLT
jgi:hypothetical protein